MPAAAAAAQAAQTAAAMINPDDPATWTNVTRNAPCPCGSGKKYKYCHGKAERSAPAIVGRDAACTPTPALPSHLEELARGGPAR